MADHVAQQIRDRVKTTCTGLTTTGSNVYASRVYPHEAANLPSLNISVGDEEIDPAEQAAGHSTYSREIEIHIEIRAVATGDIEATLLTIQKEVEVAMAGDETINGLAKSSWLTAVVASERSEGRTASSLSGEADKQVGMRNLTYTVQYVTPVASPDSVE